MGHFRDRVLIADVYLDDLNVRLCIVFCYILLSTPLSVQFTDGRRTPPPPRRVVSRQQQQGNLYTCYKPTARH